MIEFTGYEEKHRDGVVSCLMRNYEEFGAMKPEAVSKWMDPIASYRWQSDQPKDHPLQHGIVMLADGKVVGFTGCVYSYVEQGGKRYTVCKTTTAAVDREYRHYDSGDGTKARAIETMYHRILDSTDIVTGDTPIPKMRAFLHDVVGFSDYETKNYKFLTIPCFRRKLRYAFIKKPEDIADKKIRAVFADHAPYGLRCVRAYTEQSDCFVFYNLIRKKIKRRPFNKMGIRFVSVKDVTDHGMFGQYAHEIIWTIQRREKAFLESDSRFFGAGGPAYRFRYKTYETYRMCNAGTTRIDPKQLGGLYSELIMLGSP